MITVSDHHDVDSFNEGAGASLREQIVRESGIDEAEGILSMETPPDQVSTALFRFGQALTKFYDVTFLSRDRVAYTFYNDLRGLLHAILDENSGDADYILLDVLNGNNNPNHYHFATGRPYLSAPFGAATRRG